MEKHLAKDAAWSPEDLALPRVRLEVASSIREGIFVFALLAGLLAMTAGVVGGVVAMDRDRTGFVVLGGSAIFTVLVFCPLFWAGWEYREAWVVDNARRQLVRQRRLWSGNWDRVVAGFGDVAAVGVQGLEVRNKYGHWWGHAPVLALRDGTLVPVGEMERAGFERASGHAAALAAHLGVPFVPGSPEGTLVVTGMRGPGEPAVETQRKSAGLGCGPVLIGLVGLVLVFGLAAASMGAAYKLRRFF